MLRRLSVALVALFVLSRAPAIANDIVADCDADEWCVSSDSLNHRCVGDAYVYVTVSICDEGGAVVGTSSGCVLLPGVTDPENTSWEVCGSLGSLPAGTYTAKADIDSYSTGDDSGCLDADSAYYEAVAAICGNPQDIGTSGGCNPGRCAKTSIESEPFECQEPEGGQGCTPGYWKNHLDAWVGFSPDDIFDDVFGVVAFGGATLDDALNQGGGDVDALGRHAVAAILNATSPLIDYDLTVDEIIDAVAAAIESGEGIEALKDTLDELNNQGCLDDDEEEEEEEEDDD